MDPERIFKMLTSTYTEDIEIAVEILRNYTLEEIKQLFPQGSPTGVDKHMWHLNTQTTPLKPWNFRLRYKLTHIYVSFHQNCINFKPKLNVAFEKESHYTNI